MRAAFDTVADYIAAFPADRRRTLKAVRATIRKAAPDAEEGIRYGMPGYKLDGPLLYFAGFKDHWSLFALPNTQKAFRKELAPYKTTKGTAQFPWDAPVPVRLIAKITRFRAAENRAEAEAKAARKAAKRRRLQAKKSAARQVRSATRR